MTINSVALSSSEFSISGLNLPATLAAGENLDLNLTFKPAATGFQKASIKFFNGGGNLTVPASGDGVTSEVLSVSPSSVAFGQVAVGSTTG